MEEFEGLKGSSRSATIEELNPREVVPTYERWSKIELDAGDKWAQEIILSDYPRQTFKAAARHWICLVDGEEVGYLRIAGLRNEFSAFLASAPSTWISKAHVHWLHQALLKYPTLPLGLTLELGSHGHYLGSIDVWETAGLMRHERSRFMMIKSLIVG
jgi:hypothetical protein